MSIFVINKKLKREQYKNFDELVSDFLLVFRNACSYNVEDSDIYIAAKRFEKLVLDLAKKLESNIDIKKVSLKRKRL